VEKESGREIKAMKTDQGGEFTSKEFQKFCEENGIRCPLMVPRSHPTEWCGGKKNRTILNMA